MKSQKVKLEIDHNIVRLLVVGLALLCVLSFTPFLIPIIVIGAVCYYLGCWPFHRMGEEPFEKAKNDDRYADEVV